jgi:hypothetical protein
MSRAQSYQAVFRDENGRDRRCHHNHRTPEAAEECAARETRKHARAAFLVRTYEEQVKWREVLEAIGPKCPSCGTESYRAWQHVSGELGQPGSVMRCRFCGMEAKAEKTSNQEPGA